MRTREVDFDALRKSGCYTYLAFALHVKNRRPHENQINQIVVDSVICSDGKKYLPSRRYTYYQSFHYGLPVNERGAFRHFELEDEQEHMFWRPVNLQDSKLSEFTSGQPKTIYVNYRFEADSILSWASGTIRILDCEDKVIEEGFMRVRKHDTLEFPVVEP